MKKILPSADGQLVTGTTFVADLGEEEGALMEDEETVIHNLCDYVRSITEVMTPRVVVTALQQDMTIRQVLDEYPVMRFSRIPDYSRIVDDIQGLVIRSELLLATAR